MPPYPNFDGVGVLVTLFRREVGSAVQALDCRLGGRHCLCLFGLWQPVCWRRRPDGYSLLRLLGVVVGIGAPLR